MNTIHEGHKDHKWESCGKSFSIGGSLKKHIHTVHHGQKDHKCEFVVNHITSTLLSRQNKRNLCYGPILVTGVLRNFYCNF